MKLYRLECCDEDGEEECNGYFLSESNAIDEKEKMDAYPYNVKYGIIQHVVEIETED